MPTALEQEIGHGNTGLTPWSAFVDVAETVPELAWPNSINTYSQMRTDAQIVSLLLTFTLPIRRYRWYIGPNGARGRVGKSSGKQGAGLRTIKHTFDECSTFVLRAARKGLASALCRAASRHASRREAEAHRRPWYRRARSGRAVRRHRADRTSRVSESQQ
jgi:hypothetical protein